MKIRKYIILLATLVACSHNLWAQRAVQRGAALTDSVSVLADDAATVMPADTLANDTTKQRDDLEAPVVYESKDSMVWYKNGNAYLYGDGKVNYQSIELKANEITIDLETSTVYAQGTTDTLGNTK